MLTCLEASDENTNKESQGGNLSKVVLIDLTDTSSVSHRRRLVAQDFDQTRCFVILMSDRNSHPSFLHIPSHSLNNAALSMSYFFS